MKAELGDIPFDHYQRYATAARVVGAVVPDGESVLEVGANRQRLLGEFLPGHRLLYTDLEPQDGFDFVVADACALPFDDRSYSAVVSLDVLEHIPADKRVTAVTEMARVAARVVVICCPTDRPWVHEAERYAQDIWGRHMGGAYPWLEEHQEFGLVEPGGVEQALRGAGLFVHRFGQGNAMLWARLMGAHFAKEAVPELAPLVAALDRFYNREVFAGDRDATAYREVFIGLRDGNDDARVSQALAVDRPRDQAPAALLSSIGEALHPAIERVRNAERQWRDTAQLHSDSERRLQLESEAHHQTGLQLQAAEARAVEQWERADAADRKHIALETESRELRQAYAALQDEHVARETELTQLRQAYAIVQGHAERLTARVRGLERRQRWAIASAGVVVLLAAIGYFALV